MTPIRDQAPFWDGTAAKYIRRPVGDVAAYEHKVAVTQGFLRPDMRVLEIGCGSGNTARRHAPLVAEYLATDLSGEMIRLGKAKGPIPPNMRFEQGNFDEMTLTDGSFDAVLALSLLHLVPDPAATIAKIARVLTPGGVFVSSSAMGGEVWLARLLLPLGQLIGKAPHVAMLKRASFRQMIRDAGFEILVDETPGSKMTLFIVARKL